ncbi:MAG: 2,3-bisphosphoglycerate-independent phosphoglycerate mutase, partial [Proteobacteria bacterium]|nr:2,3-bisphosphoglycerate-independent phosphoglycerate mutase [Pseudomonadota bacterium]
NDTFPYFDRIRRPKVLFAGMMQYDGDLKLPERYLVNPPTISNLSDPLDCNDDYYGLQSKIAFQAQKGTLYYIQVRHYWGSASGTLVLNLE